MFDPYKIIKHPIITEKSTLLEKENKYVFCVDSKANKNQIKKAIEEIYKVKVEKVFVINVPPKKRRYRFFIEGYKSGFKKAIVKLKEGEKIAIT
ncbi:MAG: 50S ribosomal protein L23 [candidate division WOR-3 bacterium]|nr:50S ribosomal protein L23 [Candidatus Omnitrophota bacterium]MCM8807272.1 50S ribosomal protein L23 [Candidatus Omnitrophota bacterium]